MVAQWKVQKETSVNLAKSQTVVADGMKSIWTIQNIAGVIWEIIPSLKSSRMPKVWN